MHAIAPNRTTARHTCLLVWLAGLLALPIERSAAQTVNTSLVKLTYRCGNWFRIRNANAIDVPVQYAVYRASETGALTLPAAPTSIGYSDTWLQTQNRGAVLLTYNGARVAEKPNANAACAAVASMGQWSDTLSWPIVAIHSHLLPNGQVLTWGREHATVDGYTIPPGKFNGIPNIWNPATGTFTFVDAHADLFCSGHSFLPDGRLFEAGGSDDNDGLGQRFAWIFDYTTNTWTQTPNMADGRWYPTVATLANGTTFVVSGTDTTGTYDSIPEVYHPSTNTFTEMTGIASVVPYWAWLFAAPNGQLFYAGDENWTYYINTSGTGSFGAGFRPALGLLRDYGSAIMYDTGKIMIVGGGNTTATAELIDLNQASPAWQQTTSMHFPRRQMNAVLLANGKIMASGGSAGPDFNPATNIVYTPEIWDPTTQLWTEVTNYAVPRLYHSETLLLTDGRVLSVGGGQPAATGLSDNFNAEIYSPPYLFNPDGSPVTSSRPIITSAPTSSVGYGSNFQLTVQNVAAGTAQVLWIRIGSVTHAINMNQRLNHLAASQSGQTLTVTAPANANLAPPGHYLLFVLNANGVPSVGTIVQIGS
jgi:galactose oxidase